MSKRNAFTIPIIIAGFVWTAVKYYLETRKQNRRKLTIRTNLREVKQVVIIGDSIARGYGASNGGLTPNLKQFFDSKYGEIEVINKGIDQLTSKGLLRHIETDKSVRSAIANTNIVLINIGGNDLIKQFKNGGTKEVVFHLFGTRKIYVRNLGAIVKQIKTLNPTAAILVNSLYNSLDTNYQYFGFTSILFRFWNRSIKQEEIIKINTKGLTQGDKDIWVDMVHPNDKGYEALSKIIIQQLKPYLADES